MKGSLLSAFSALGLSGLLGIAVSAPPPLPQWDDEAWREMELHGPDLGGTLFPRNEASPIPDVIEHTEIPQEVAQIPEVISLGAVEDLPADLVESYFPDTLEARVLDPQSLLTQARLDGILHFLGYHFREARSTMHIMVLKPMQRLPRHLDLQEIHRQWFGDSLSVLVVYNFGNPGMSRLIFGKETERRVPEARRVNACVESINEAMVASNAEDQLERFLTELSRKLYWIEDVYHGEQILDASSNGAPSEYLSEAPAVEVVSKGKLWFSILAISAVLALAGGFIVSLQRRAANKTFYFPERRHFPRLGAPHGGGNRLVVAFGGAREKPKVS